MWLFLLKTSVQIHPRPTMWPGRAQTSIEFVYPVQIQVGATYSQSG